MAARTTSGQVRKRRVFLEANGSSFQILTFEQNAADSSIYLSAPKFDDIIWLTPALNEKRAPVLLYSQAEGPGKLSLHGSGVTHVKPYEGNEPNGFVMRGSPLRDRATQDLRVRHLVTLFMSEPKHCPTSPANARTSDIVVRSEHAHPYVFVLWAVPQQGDLEIQIDGTFQADELEEVPPNAGWGGFGLVSHGIIWFAYRTKHMGKWPRYTHACYLDGYAVPLLFGTAEGEFRLEMRRPRYEASPGKLRIGL